MKTHCKEGHEPESCFHHPKCRYGCDAKLKRARVTFAILAVVAVVSGVITAEVYYWQGDYTKATYFTAQALLCWKIYDWLS